MAGSWAWVAPWSRGGAWGGSLTKHVVKACVAVVALEAWRGAFGDGLGA